MDTVSVRTRWFAGGVLVALLSAFVVTQAWQVDASPGDEDSTFVPVPACRLADTRPDPFRVGTRGALQPEETETVQVHGANGKCVIPDDAVGVSLNVTAVDATQPTFLTFWPEGTLPTASSLNPVPGQPPTPNAVSTKLTSDGSFEMYNLAGSVEVIIDVNGYYTSASLLELGAMVTDLNERVMKLESIFPKCEGTTPSATLDLAGPSYQLKLTGNKPGVPAIYESSINLNFTVTDGVVTGNPQYSDPPEATGTTSGSFVTDPQTLMTTWDSGNKGQWIYKDVKILENGKDFCGNYEIVADDDPTDVLDSGTFTMTGS